MGGGVGDLVVAALVSPPPFDGGTLPEAIFSQSQAFEGCWVPPGDPPLAATDRRKRGADILGSIPSRGYVMSQPRAPPSPLSPSAWEPSQAWGWVSPVSDVLAGLQLVRGGIQNERCVPQLKPIGGNYSPAPPPLGAVLRGVGGGGGGRVLVFGPPPPSQHRHHRHNTAATTVTPPPPPPPQHRHHRHNTAATTVTPPPPPPPQHRHHNTRHHHTTATTPITTPPPPPQHRHHHNNTATTPITTPPPPPQHRRHHRDTTATTPTTTPPPPQHRRHHRDTTATTPITTPPPPPQHRRHHRDTTATTGHHRHHPMTTPHHHNNPPDTPPTHPPAAAHHHNNTATTHHRRHRNHPPQPPAINSLFGVTPIPEMSERSPGCPGLAPTPPPRSPPEYGRCQKHRLVCTNLSSLDKCVQCMGPITSFKWIGYQCTATPITYSRAKLGSFGKTLDKDV
ncbi:hypothetical protein CRUP_037235, partial [Coryphaenoides rupestris]